MNKTAGLDYGTTNSSIGYTTNGEEIKIINLNNGSLEDRTALFYDFEEKTFTVGEEVIKRKIDGEFGRLILSPKSFLNSSDDVKTYIGQKEYSLEEITSIIIKKFKNKLEQNLGQEIGSVLIGRPVKFHDTDINLDIVAQEKLKEAAKLAGFKNIEFQYESVAAANAYLKKNPLFKDGNIIIADLGGGNSDFTIVNIKNGNKKIVGNNGIYIGGDEIDRLFSLNYFSSYLGRGNYYNSLGKQTKIPNLFYHHLSDWKNIYKLLEDKIKIEELYNRLDKEVGEKFSRLLDISKDLTKGYEYYSLVEQIKRNLTDEEKIIADFNIFKNPFKKEVLRQDFEEIIKVKVEEIGNSINELLKISGLKAGDIDKIVMTGGTSLIPIIRKTIEKTLGKGKIENSDTFTSVVYGLTLESFERFR